MDLSAHSSTIFYRLSVFLTDRNGLPFLADSLIHQLASKTQLFRSISDDEETLWRNVDMDFRSVSAPEQAALSITNQGGADGTAIRAHAPAGFGIGVQAESIDGPGVVATNTRIRAHRNQRELQWRSCTERDGKRYQCWECRWRGRRWKQRKRLWSDRYKTKRAGRYRAVWGEGGRHGI